MLVQMQVIFFTLILFLSTQLASSTLWSHGGLFPFGGQDSGMG